MQPSFKQSALAVAIIASTHLVSEPAHAAFVAYDGGSKNFDSYGGGYGGGYGGSIYDSNAGGSGCGGITDNVDGSAQCDTPIGDANPYSMTQGSDYGDGGAVDNANADFDNSGSSGLDAFDNSDSGGSDSFTTAAFFGGSGGGSARSAPAVSYGIWSPSVAALISSSGPSRAMAIVPHPSRSLFGSGDWGAVSVGDPINAATGNKYAQELDYRSIGIMALHYQRFYNSVQTGAAAELGAGWRSSYDSKVQYIAGQTNATVVRPDGKNLIFTLSNGSWSPQDPAVSGSLVQRNDSNGNLIGWSYTTHADIVESYDVNGRLQSITNRIGLSDTLAYNSNGSLASVTDPFGHQLSFTYDSQLRLTQMTDPAGNHYGYAYDANNNLSVVTYPDTTTRKYVYENTAFPNALTGIIDGNANRFVTWTYDSQGRAISSALAGGVQATLLSYNTGSTVVTDALGAVRTHSFQNFSGAWKQTGLSVTCSSCTTLNSTVTYGSNGYQPSITDFNGNTTTYTYNNRSLLSAITRAVGKPEQQTVTIAWHPVFHRPTQITYADHTVAMNYDSLGNLLTRIVTDNATGATRTWTYTYNAWGEVLTAKGPRTDVNATTTYAYDNYGRLTSMTNALGQVVKITQYDVNGRPLSITDPNGVVTTLQYDVRERLVSSTTASHKWTSQYDNAGALIKSTDPTGVTRTYTYDTAHRLIDTADSVGDHIHLTRNAAGSITAQTRTNSTGQVVQSASSVFDALGHRTQVADAYQNTTTYTYDNNGNMLTRTDPLNHKTSFAYDALNRIVTGTDAASGITQIQYDALNRVIAVKDPRGNSTSYTYNGFGNALSVKSPDSGAKTMTYDAAGNLIKKVDARGIESDYTYDALNRITAISYPASASENVTFKYDDTTTANYRIGRLNSVQNNGLSTTYVYDADGNLTSRSESATALSTTTQYLYDSAHRLQQITYPSGRVVVYTRNTLGQITKVQTKASASATLQSIVSSVTYEPFGPAKNVTYANGVTTTFLHDLDLRASRITTTAATKAWDFAYGYDAVGNILSITDQNTPSSYSKAYTYDNQNRVITDTISGITYSYQYDANGNRTALNIPAYGASNTQTYAAGSNHETGFDCATIAEDAAGNVTSEASAIVYNGTCMAGAGSTLQYNSANHLSQYSQTGGSNATYQYNGLGQRVFKQSAQTTYYDYLPNGKYLVEAQLSANNTYSLSSEFIWLDNMPVAQIQNTYGTSNVVASSTTLYIHADHLNTPRVITSSAKKIVWRWDSDAYIASGPNQDPGNTGTQTVLDLGFPGQIADAESGLYYNHSRYYDPSNARYTQSDPIGLNGGLNTYAYVKGNPIKLIDPKGLASVFEPYIEDPNRDGSETYEGFRNEVYPPLGDTSTPGYNSSGDEAFQNINDPIPDIFPKEIYNPLDVPKPGNIICAMFSDQCDEHPPQNDGPPYMCPVPGPGQSLQP